MKVEKIPKQVVEEAEFIKECLKNGQQYSILKSRSIGGMMAKRLAEDTIDIEHEEIKKCKT